MLVTLLFPLLLLQARLLLQVDPHRAKISHHLFLPDYPHVTLHWPLRHLSRVDRLLECHLRPRD